MVNIIENLPDTARTSYPFIICIFTSAHGTVRVKEFMNIPYSVTVQSLGKIYILETILKFYLELKRVDGF